MTDTPTIKKLQYFDKALQCWFVYHDDQTSVNEEGNLIGYEMHRAHYADIENPVEGIEIVKSAPDRTLSATTGRYKKKNYLSNSQMVLEIRRSKAQGKCSEKLAAMLYLLAHRISLMPNWAGYSWREEYVASGAALAVEKYDKFNEEKVPPGKQLNPFSFYSQVIINNNKQIVNRELREIEIKMKSMAENGLDTSFKYDEEHGSRSTYKPDPTQDYIPPDPRPPRS